MILRSAELLDRSRTNKSCVKLVCTQCLACEITHWMARASASDALAFQDAQQRACAGGLWWGSRPRRVRLPAQSLRRCIPSPPSGSGRRPPRAPSGPCVANALPPPDDAEGLIKVLTDAKTDRILGVHIMSTVRGAVAVMARRVRRGSWARRAAASSSARPCSAWSMAHPPRTLRARATPTRCAASFHRRARWGADGPRTLARADAVGGHQGGLHGRLRQADSLLSQSSSACEPDAVERKWV